MPRQSVSRPIRTGFSPREHPAAARASKVTASRLARRVRSASIGGQPYATGAHRNLAWPATDLDPVDDLRGARVDAGDRPVDRARHPDGAGADGDTARTAPSANGRRDRICLRVDPEDTVVERRADPHASFACSDCSRDIGELDRREDAATEAVQPPEPP